MNAAVVVRRTRQGGQERGRFKIVHVPHLPCNKLLQCFISILATCVCVYDVHTHECIKIATPGPSLTFL